MEKSDIQKRIDKEKRKLKKALSDASVSEDILKLMLPVLENVALMKVKLEDSQEELQEASITVEYDNGGGQTGVRENPLFKAYEGLWKTYIAGMDRIFDLLSGEQISELEKDKPQSVLDMVRARHRKEA